MAKRKRLTPAQGEYLSGPDAGQRAPETKSMPMTSAPIAQVAGEASARAALEDLADVVKAARASGRMIEEIPLDQIDENYLVRDRLVQDEDEMTALMDSLRARGQQMPIEVVRLPDPVDGRAYGLISGWRRLTALKRLYSAGSEPNFGSVRALVIAPDTAQDAYVAMVEENEIRVNLSHYERARIAVRAMRQGVYDTQRAALQGLYASTTRSKRSKIGSFIALVESLDDTLRHPTVISEKLGLDLVRELVRDPGLADRLKARLAKIPRDTPGPELQVLREAVQETQTPVPAPGVGVAPPAPPTKTDASKAPSDRASRVTRQIADGLRMSSGSGKVELTGDAVDEALIEALEQWLRGRL